MVLETLLYLAAVIILSEVLRPKPKIENARPAGIGDFQFPTATEGRAVPLLFGRNPIKGPNVVWYGDFQSDAITEKVKTGLFSSTRITKGFRYRAAVQFALCRGTDLAPVVLRRIRISEKEVFSGAVTGVTRFDIDEPELFGGDEFGTGGIQATCDWFPGTTTQAVSVFLDTADRQRIASAATPTAPRYIGTCYVVAREMTSTAATSMEIGAYLGNSASIQAWEFEVERFPPTFNGQAAGEHKIGDSDCNPINVIYELLTNTEWGFGIASSSIDIGVGSSFLKAADNCAAEDNGFAMLVDRVQDKRAFLREISRQIDAVVFLNSATGLWTINLARDASDTNFGYDVNTAPQLTDDSIKELVEYDNGDWEDTTNQVQVGFHARVDDYKKTFAPAQNSSAAIILGGGSITAPKSSPTIIEYPGVKRSSVAQQIAWRDIRALSRPLARAKFKVGRSFWDIAVNDVCAWTDSRLGHVKLPMRVTSIDYGELADNAVQITAVEDVFSAGPGSFGSNPGTNWNEPQVTLSAYPAGEQLAFEAPRAMAVLGPLGSLATAALMDSNIAGIMVAARRQGSEVAVELRQRNDTSPPSGAFAAAGTVVQFMRIGELSSALSPGTGIPTATIMVTATPDSQSALLAEFETVTNEDMGTSLAHLVLVGSEFMLVTNASPSGGDLNFESVFRGALDSGQQAHTAGESVYLIFSGANLMDTTFDNTRYVDVELTMRSAREVFSGSVTTISLQMDKRTLRPYPPASLSYNASSTPFNTPNLEGSGSGLNGVGFNVNLRRRRYDTGDEVAEMMQDNSVSATTQHRVRVYVDPTGSNDLASDSGWFSGASLTGGRPTQADIVTFGAAGTTIRVRVDSRHDVGTETQLESRYATYDDATPVSSRTSQFYLGGDIPPSTPTNAYTAVATGTFTVNIGAAYSTSDVEYRINATPWSTVIAAGSTTGTIPGVSASDTLELQHTASESPDPQFVEIQNPSSAAVAYGAFSA